MNSIKWLNLLSQPYPSTFNAPTWPFSYIWLIIFLCLANVSCESPSRLKQQHQCVIRSNGERLSAFSDEFQSWFVCCSSSSIFRLIGFKILPYSLLNRVVMLPPKSISIYCQVWFILLCSLQSVSPRSLKVICILKGPVDGVSWTPCP